MSNNVPLFACSKCFSKHPFEELSSGQQLCKNCRGAFPIVKCTYCRSEFQQTKGGKTDRMVTNWLSSGCHPNRSSVSQQLGARFCDVANEGGILSKTGTSTICNKCEHNVKQFGKPSACEYCNIIAAFIGNKCQRCTNSERKYGPPVTCEQCKQKCAFDRKDDDKKVDGKLLCWLCTLSYKRALAKTKHGDAGRRAQLQMAQRSNNNNKSRSENRIRSGSKRPSSGKPEVKVEAGSGGGGHRDGTDPSSLPPMVKAMRTNRPPGDLIDPNSSDHVVAMTQLKEQLVSLQKQISQKDSQLLAKDRMITELKAKNFTSETELRNKMQSTEREFDKKVDLLSHKIKSLRKEVAVLTKSNKKTVISSGGGIAAGGGGGGGSGGSGTDSPLP